MKLFIYFLTITFSVYVFGYSIQYILNIYVCTLNEIYFSVKSLYMRWLEMGAALSIEDVFLFMFSLVLRFSSVAGIQIFPMDHHCHFTTIVLLYFPIQYHINLQKQSKRDLFN